MPQSVASDGTSFQPTEDPVTTMVTYLDPLDHLGPSGHLPTRQQIEAELDMIAGSVRTFHRLQPDMVLKYCSGYTARLTELTVLLHRVESTDRQYTRVRTQQVDKFIVELERQWKTASRLIEVMRQDLELSR